MTTHTARPNTPDRINDDGSRTITSKRACNGCGQLLGDVSRLETALAIAGQPLPDVRKECTACGPTAPEPACLCAQTVDGDPACLDGVCDHAVEPGADYCTNTAKHTICLTHSTVSGDGAITHAEPWPCKHSAPAA